MRAGEGKSIRASRHLFCTIKCYFVDPPRDCHYASLGSVYIPRRRFARCESLKDLAKIGLQYYNSREIKKLTIMHKESVLNSKIKVEGKMSNEHFVSILDCTNFLLSLCVVTILVTVILLFCFSILSTVIILSDIATIVS